MYGKFTVKEKAQFTTAPSWAACSLPGHLPASVVRVNHMIRQVSFRLLFFVHPLGIDRCSNSIWKGSGCFIHV